MIYVQEMSGLAITYKQRRIHSRKFEHGDFKITTVCQILNRVD